MHRFVQGFAFLGFDVDLAERGRWQHAERARQHCRDIREHVAEQIVGDDDVESLRPFHQIHPAGVGELMLELHVLVFARVNLADHFVPQHAGFHDVALFHRGQLVAALACQIESDARDALDFIGVVDLGIDGALLAVAEIGDGFGFAEIDAAGELAHDHDIEALDHLALQARGVGERGIAHRGAQVREQAEFLAQAKQPRLGPRIIRDAVPLRTANRAEDHGVGSHCLRHGRIGNALLARVIGGTADQALLGLEMRNAFRVQPADQAIHLGHYFGADTVTGEKQQFMGRHRKVLVFFARYSGCRANGSGLGPAR